MAKGVLKEISKLSKVPHPRSRKTAQLTRKAIRATNRDKVKNSNLLKQNLLGEKFLWFKERIESVEDVTPAKVLELIESYLGRFDEELEQIQIKHSVGHRKGRQHASREDSIKSTKKHEAHEFNTCGIEMPQLLNPKQLSMLMEWEGELRLLQNFEIARYSRSNLESMIKRSKKGGEKKSVAADEEQETESEEKDVKEAESEENGVEEGKEKESAAEEKHINIEEMEVD